MFALLVAYVQGRGGVLDDRGKVIDTQIQMEWDPDDVDQYAIDETEDADVAVVVWWKRVYGLGVGIGGFLVALLFIGMTIRWAWMFSGFIGHSVFGVPGVYGNVAGLVTGCGLFAAYWVMSTRLGNARRDLRARRGERNLVDCTLIHGLLIRGDRCGACGFLIRETGRESDGCVQCPECGGGLETSVLGGVFCRGTRGDACGSDEEGVWKVLCV